MKKNTSATKLKFFVLPKRLRKGLVTKEDLEKKAEAIISSMDEKYGSHFERLYADHRHFIEKVREENRQMKEDFQKKMMFLNENIVHDFRGAFSDRTEWLKDKVNAHDGEISRIKHFLRLR